MVASDQVRYHLEQAMALDALYAAPRLALAQRLLDGQRPDAAARMFTEALAAATGQSDHLAQAATAFGEKNNFDRAKQSLLKAIDQNHLAARAALELGLIQLQAGDPEAAVEHFSRAVELDPDLAPAYYQLGLLAHGQPAEAYLRKAVELDFRLTEAHLALARLLEDSTEAEYHYRIALDLEPNVTDETLEQRFG